MNKIYSSVALFLLMMVVVFGVEIAYAEKMQLINNGRAVAGTTAIWYDDTPEEIQKRLFSLTILINQSLAQITGRNFTQEDFNNFENRIRIKIADEIGENKFALWLVDTEGGKELRISGNNIDTTEEAVDYFIKKYLRIPQENINAIKEFLKEQELDRVKIVTGLPFNDLQWNKVDNLIFEQEDLEVVRPKL